MVPEDRRGWLQPRGPCRVLLPGALRLVAFVTGPDVDMTVYAHLGPGIGLASAMLALAPFASHRHRELPNGDPQPDRTSASIDRRVMKRGQPPPGGGWRACRRHTHILCFTIEYFHEASSMIVP